MVKAPCDDWGEKHPKTLGPYPGTESLKAFRPSSWRGALRRRGPGLAGGLGYLVKASNQFFPSPAYSEKSMCLL